MHRGELDPQADVVVEAGDVGRASATVRFAADKLGQRGLGAPFDAGDRAKPAVAQLG
jgi:hypothetical protein